MEEEFDYLRPNKVFFLDTNLSSPVIDVEIEATHTLIKNHRAAILRTGESKTFSRHVNSELTYFRKLCKLRGWKSADLLECKPLSPLQYEQFEQLARITPHNFKSLYDEAQVIAKNIERAVADGLEKRGLPRESIEGTADQLNLPEIRPYRVAYEEFSNFYGRAEARTKTSENIWTFGTVGNTKIWINSRRALVELDGTLYYSSANQILMLKDKLSTRFMLLEHVAPLRLGMTLIGHLQKLFVWQDQTLSLYGNEAYEILKAVEPLFKTRLTHVTDKVFGSDTAYTRMIIKMNLKEMKVIGDRGWKPTALRSLCEIIEQVTLLDHLVELFGCQKSCGHPIIDPRRGGLSAAAEARTPDTTRFQDAQRLRNTFCHIIMTTFLSKNGRWPPLNFLKKGLKLELLYTRQERDVSYRSYELSEWNFVSWGKMFEMDYYPNFLELMDDKAISFYRSEKHLTWDEGHATSQRRLLLEVLRRPEINIKEIVDRVSRRDIPWDWFIVSLYPKEREFKLDPRMFAMLVLEMRCFFTCVEANIADNVFKYMPQQTMTKTKTQIQERFLAFTDPSRDVNNHTLFLEVDLSRWNLKWRELCVHMIGHDINDMFGVAGTFTVTHWFFKKCQILVRVAGIRPDGIEQEYPPESSTAYRGHQGGFEGLAQKSWSADTFAMCEMALQPLIQEGIISSYELVGQGDNQVLRISIPKDDRSATEVIPAVRDRVNAELTSTCASVGQEVKPEENVESCNVLTYSKDVFIDGVEYPTTLKKHSRLFPVTASDFPSTTAKASAIMAGVVAGAENSRHTLCSAVVGWYHTARYLLSASHGYTIHGHYGPKFSSSQIIAALIIPPSIGGMIGTPVASFLYKGGSDPLGKEVSSLKLLADSPTEVGVLAGRALRGLEEKYCFASSPNLEILIDNPYGLPIDKVTSPLGQVSHLTLEAFKGKVINRDIKPLLDRSVEVSEQKLKNDILAIRPCNPILAHDLFEASGFGTVKEMRKMFLNTRTVQSIAQWVNPNITHNFLRADMNDILWFFSWLKGLPRVGYSTSDSYTLVSKARAAWGLQLHGVTNYQPLDYYHQSHTVRDQSSIKWSAHAGRDLLYTRGSLSGYLGTATKEKFSEHGYKIVDSGAPSRAIMKLQKVRSQANGNENLSELLDRIGLTRTNCRLSWISDVLSKVIGGSLAHKFASVVRSMAASYVGPLNFVTHIRLDTDSLGRVSGGSDNYSIMTQEFMVLTMAQAKLLYLHRGVNSGELLIDTSSMIPIPDDALLAQPPTFDTASLPRTKLLYTPDLILQRTYDNIARSVPRGSIALTEMYPQHDTIEKGFVGFFVELLRDQSRAKALADTRGQVAIPGRLQIDIAESHSLGLVRLSRCMAKAIWISNLRDTFRTLHMHPDRWDEALYLTHNITACVKSCSNYLRHPLCWTHPDSDSLRGSSLGYSRDFSVQRRMEALVKRNIVKIYQSDKHPFWLEDVPVFSSENSMTLVESLSVAAIKRVYVLYLNGNHQAQHFASLLASYTRMSVKKSLSADEQLELLRVRLTKLGAIYRRLGDMILGAQMMSLANMKGLIVFNDDAKTVMRYARNLLTTEGPPRPRRLKITGVPPIPDETVCAKCLPDPVSRREAIWRKNSQRPNGGLSAAGYTWLPILSTVRIMKHVWIIGSGNGGVADLLITMFDCDVTGIDLETDMPREAATLLNYVPIGIQRCNTTRYTQSDLSISTSGNWFDVEVREQIFNQISTATTIIIDITESNDILMTSIHDALKRESVDSVLCRFIGSRTEFDRTMLQLNTDFSARAWLSSNSSYSIECLIEVRRPRHEFVHTCSSVRWLHELITDDMHRVIPDRAQELIEAATFSVIAEQSVTSLHDVNDELTSLCRSLLNKNRSRQMLYRDRMSLIWAHITTTMAIHPDPTRLLQEWISDEMVETPLLRYAIRERLTTHLLRYVPRLRRRFPIS